MRTAYINELEDRMLKIRLLMESSQLSEELSNELNRFLLSDIPALVAEKEQIEVELSQCRQKLGIRTISFSEAISDKLDLSYKNLLMEVALGYYADPLSYEDTPENLDKGADYVSKPILEDCGQKAREVLLKVSNN